MQKLDQDFHHLFGRRDVLEVSWLKRLQQSGWLGQLSASLRSLCWQVMLGVLPLDKTLWPSTLEEKHEEYEALKKRLWPDINSVQADPLFGEEAEEEEGEWSVFYKKLEAIKFIQGDLERLYMNGVDGEYFQDPDRSNSLLHVLFIWAEESPNKLGYRQGMHEIAAPLLLAVETTMSIWSEAQSQENDEHLNLQYINPDLVKYFSCKKYLESSVYWLFHRLMEDLELLYRSPLPGSVPAVVGFCTQIQDEMLRALDPALCVHLEENYVQAQLYGMRWSRLLLGREFDLDEDSLLRIWDYMFACALDIPKPTREAEHSVELSSEPVSPSDPLNSSGSDEWVPSGTAIKATIRSRFDKPCLILESLSDFMLAMLLHIRDDLLNGDNSSTLGLLMRYPPVEDVTPIIDLADMIRRGVLDSNSHIGGRPEEFSDEDEVATASPGKNLPTWLWKESVGSKSHCHESDSPLSMKSLQGVTKRVSEKISTAVSSSMSALSGDDSSPPKNKSRTRTLSFSARSSLFGTTPRPSGHANRQQLCNDSTVTSAEGELEDLDKETITRSKLSVLVHKEILQLAGFLEGWTSDKDRQDPSEFMPDVVSRLRQLGGLLDETLTEEEYHQLHTGQALEYHRGDHAHASRSGGDDKVSSDSEEAFGNDFFSSNFGVKSTTATRKETPSSSLLSALVGDEGDRKRDAAKMEALFS